MGERSGRVLLQGRRSLPERIYRRVRWRLYVDRAGGPGDSLLLAGSARGGTTWAAEAVVHDQNVRYVFEPFHPDHVPLAQRFQPRRYLRPDDRDPEATALAARLLTGEGRSWWTDHYNRAVLPRHRLVKEVRANLLLGWLKERFPGLRMALLVRHPCAVVASQLAAGWDFHTGIDNLLSQPQLVDDHLRDVLPLLRAARDPVEQMALTWCVENIVPLRQFGRGEIHVICYEHLVRRPSEELPKLMAFYGLAFKASAIGQMARASRTTTVSSALATGNDPVSSWSGRLTEAQVATIMRLVSAFGLDRLYGPEPMPRMPDPALLLGTGQA